MEAWVALADLARRQRGLVTLRQAQELGLDERTIQRHVAHRGWERPHRGTYALPGSVRSYERDVAAALLSAGPRAAASHETAATLLGLQRRGSRPLHMVVPIDRRSPTLQGVRAHRSRTLLTTDIGRVGGLTATSAARTLCDLAPIDRERLRELTAVALQSGVTSIDRIVGTSQRLGRHPGAAQLRAVVEQLLGSSSDSGFERRSRAWLCDEGLPPHPCLYPVRAEDDVLCELDIAYPDEMVYVDCRGFPFHSLPEALRVDDVRSNGIVAAGWLGLALDAAQLTARSATFLRQLRGLLASRRGFARQWDERHGPRKAPSPRGWS